jgi:hypothetical protein
MPHSFFLFLLITLVTFSSFAKTFEFSFTKGSANGFMPIFRDIPLSIYNEYLRRKANGTMGPRAPLANPPGSYPEDISHWLMNSGIYSMPDGLKGMGFLLQGNNHSDDMDMFLVKEWDKQQGILPNKEYKLYVTVDLAADAPIGAFGAGGDPELIILAMVTEVDPTRFVIDGQKDVRHPDLQIFPELQTTVVGTTGVCYAQPAEDQSPACPEEGRIRFALKKGKESSPIRIQSGKEGKFWLMIGGHSGFESLSAIYYSKIKVRLEEHKELKGDIENIPPEKKFSKNKFIARAGKIFPSLSHKQNY